MAPLTFNSEENTEPSGNIEEESSNWTVLVRHDLSGGLSVKARYLRGSSRKRELLLLGLDPKSTSVICVQIKFENRRTDGLGIRRIRLLQRKVTASGAVPITRMMIPQEIDMLKSAQMSYAMVGIEFAQVSDKDGAMVARFDFKCDRSSTSVDIRTPLAELLVGKEKTSISDFSQSMQKLHGIHQRALCSIDLTSSGGSVSSRYDELPAKILKSSNLSLVGDKEWNNNVSRFIGLLPACDKEVLIEINCNRNTGVGEITICCDSAMALNSLLGFLKRAVL